MLFSRWRTSATLLVLVAGIALVGTAIASSQLVAHAGTRPAPILTVAAENQYADVLRQIGGERVSVVSLMSNPNADPHAYEASPQVARTIAGARLVVQNGLGYDAFMNKLEGATPSRLRMVVSAQQLRHLADSTLNPHLWYSPKTMPLVAKAIAADLAVIDPGHRALFAANLATFDASLKPWFQVLSQLAAHARGANVATTEPVADALLDAGKVHDATPWSFQADTMNGVDPAPQSVAFEEHLLSAHVAKALIYNAQVTSTLTTSLLQLATNDRVPVVAVYETMPSGFHYQGWMVAETNALLAAIAHGRSTRRLR